MTGFLNSIRRFLQIDALIRLPNQGILSFLESAVHFLPYMVDNRTVFMLRAEHHDIRIFFGPDAVPGRPVEQVTTT